MKPVLHEQHETAGIVCAGVKRVGHYRYGTGVLMPNNLVPWFFFREQGALMTLQPRHTQSSHHTTRVCYAACTFTAAAVRLRARRGRRAAAAAAAAAVLLLLLLRVLHKSNARWGGELLQTTPNTVNVVM